MYFVHPQIRLNKEIFKEIFSWFLAKPNKKDLEDKLSFYFPNRKIIFTDMGRSALQIIVENLNLKNSSILMPAYICSDVFYPFLEKNNLSPVFLDINLGTFNIDIEEIEKKISPPIKSIIIPNIYGLPNNLEKILSIIQKYNLRIIEDCAHSFGGKYNEVYVGNFGDAALFSLYKFFPIITGGMLVCPKSWEVDLVETSFSFRDILSFLNCFPLCAYLFKKFSKSIVPKMVRKEKAEALGRINNISLNIFSYFFNDHEEKLAKRIQLALFFQKELKNLGFKTQESTNNIFCYLSVLIPKDIESQRDTLIKILRKYKIFATRMWYTPIILNPEAQKKYNIKLEEFPSTVEAANRIINFPLQNFYERKDIQKMIEKLKLALRELKK